MADTISPRLSPREQLERAFDLLRRAVRYAWLVVLVTAVGGALSVLLALTRSHQYESETVLLYRELISRSVLQGRDVAQSSNTLSARYKEILLARSNLVQVIREFGLFPDTVEDQGEVAAADLLRSRISFRDKGAGTFRITYRGATPAEAQKVTQLLARRLRDEDSRLRREQAEVTKNFLQAEKADADEELKGRERTLAQFLAQHPEFVTDASGGSSAGASIRAQQKKPAAQGDPRLGALERQRNRIRARLANPNAPVPVARETPADRRAMGQETRQAQRDVDEAQRDLQDKLSLYTDKHPDVSAARGRLSAAQARLRRAEAGIPPASAEEPVVAAPVNKAALERELAKVEREIAGFRARQSGQESSANSKVADDVVLLETEWSRLLRTVEEARERVSSLESRVFTADITASSEFAEAAQISVIDEAYLPHQPAGKSRRVLVMAGGLLFGGLGIALALGLALIDDRIYRRSDLERLGLAPVLVVIPAARARRHGWRRRRLGRRGGRARPAGGGAGEGGAG